MNERPPLPSLLDRAPALPGLALADLTDDEREQGEGTAKHPCGEFSAARFATLYPERYALVARALLEGFSLDTAARVFKIHERTAAAIREREARSLSAESYRGVQARHARGVVLAATDLLAERLRRDPDSIGTRDLVAAVRELHNVERALEGAPSSVVGVIRADGASAALADLLQQAASAAAARRPARNGFEGGEIPAREAVGEVVEAVAVAPARAGSVAESPAKPQKTEDFRASDTAGDTSEAATVPASPAVVVARSSAATGAGGVPAQQGGPFREDRLGSENFCPVVEGTREVVSEKGEEG